MARQHSPEIKKDFAKKVMSGTKAPQAYEEVTGTTGHSAVVGAGKWMKLPEIQKLILQNSQERLLKCGMLSVKRLEQGLKAINPKKMTGTSINLIKLGMQMSGLLDKKIDVAVTETHTMSQEVLAVLQQIGQRHLENAKDLTLADDGTYTVTDDSKPDAEPGHK